MPDRDAKIYHAKNLPGDKKLIFALPGGQADSCNL
jgi:tRNA A37 threonylcarbamoyladenosine synthetase subunit TsaC/SUA5/YrdC